MEGIKLIGHTICIAYSLFWVRLYKSLILPDFYEFEPSIEKHTNNALWSLDQIRAKTHVGLYGEKE